MHVKEFNRVVFLDKKNESFAFMVSRYGVILKKTASRFFYKNFCWIDFRFYFLLVSFAKVSIIVFSVLIEHEYTSLYSIMLFFLLL